MRIRWNLQRLVTLAGLAVLVPTQAHALTGGALIAQQFANLVTAFWPLWTTVAVLVIVIAGFTLMISHDENAIDKAKTTIIAVVIGGVITVIITAVGATNVVSWVYDGTYGRTFGTTFAPRFGLEAVGIANWITAMAAMVGILIIIITVVKAVASFGGDESAYSQTRTVLLHVIFGLILIGGATLVNNVFFAIPAIVTGPDGINYGISGGNPNPIIALVRAKIGIVLGFMTLIAVAILVFAGFRMVTSFGREEEYTAAKSLAGRVVVGLLVILVSYSLVAIVARLF